MAGAPMAGAPMARVPPAVAIAPRRLRRLIRGDVFLSGRASLRTTTASVVPVRHMIPTSSNRSCTPGYARGAVSLKVGWSRSDVRVQGSVGARKVASIIGRAGPDRGRRQRAFPDLPPDQ